MSNRPVEPKNLPIKQQIELLNDCIPLMQNLQNVQDLADYQLSPEELEVLRGFVKVLLSNMEWPEKRLNPRFIWLAGEAGLGPTERSKLAYMLQVVKRRATQNRNIRTGQKLLLPAFINKTFAHLQKSSPELLVTFRLQVQKIPKEQYANKLRTFFHLKFKIMNKLKFLTRLKKAKKLLRK